MSRESRFIEREKHSMEFNPKQPTTVEHWRKVAALLLIHFNESEVFVDLTAKLWTESETKTVVARNTAAGLYLTLVTAEEVAKLAKGD